MRLGMSAEICHLLVNTNTMFIDIATASKTTCALSCRLFRPLNRNSFSIYLPWRKLHLCHHLALLSTEVSTFHMNEID
jgi:hypothetical protein